MVCFILYVPDGEQNNSDSHARFEFLIKYVSFQIAVLV